MKIKPCPLNKSTDSCPSKIINNVNNDKISTKMQLANIIKNGKKRKMKLETTSTVKTCFNFNFGIQKKFSKNEYKQEISNKDGKARSRLCCN